MSFKRLDPEDISISAESVVAPAWSSQATTLPLVGGTFYTSSQQPNSDQGKYYFNIYQVDPADQQGVISSLASTQFSIAYANVSGSGSVPINASIPGSTPSSINYGQYRTLINGDENTNFTFGTVTPQSVYIISVNRARYKEKLLPGSFNLTLTNGSNTIKLTDNSKSVTAISYVDAGRVFDIVSGSDGVPYSGTGFTPNSGSYGKFLPDVGTIILNGAALSGSNPGGASTALSVAGGIGMPINQASNVSSKPNLEALYNVIKAGGNFKLQSEETVSSNYVFVRVRNSEFNYSTNPSIISGSGELRYNVLVNSPQAYITTVGMYNDNNDLLAVAKLSKPLLKDFTKEALVRIKLDY
jgi:hypothetical protein